MDINTDNMLKVEKLFSVSSTYNTLIFISILVILLRVLSSSGPPKNIPLINGAKFYELTDLLARWRFSVKGRKLVKTDLAKANIFGIITDTGYQVVLHPKFAHEIRDNPILNPRKAFANLMHLDIPGFEATKEFVREDGLFQNAVRTKLLKMLFPSVLRKPVAQILPSCRRLRKYLRDSTRIVESIIHERQIAKTKALRQGKIPRKYFDAIECFEEAMCGEVYNPVHTQLTLSFVAIHTTSDMLIQVLYDLAEREELIHALREEIKAVLPQGWNKFTVTHLKLMDSVLKESQRLKPLGFVSMRRVAEEPLLLSDGTVIPEGSSILVSSERQWDEAYYPDPKTFDPYRFLKLRESPGHKASAQLETTSPDNLS
ncbi:cytochrome P450 [Aspergillus affinis]|uniref:cytochrome P450 n=1 Tax=Aspergillus affinis TaxID=1070780 RepID=UPI0022FE1056|nr:cytochrome P450 [Aspergillus affinis]KAI9038302.1 cytochrome P450 [Aspergillus affinis]